MLRIALLAVSLAAVATVAQVEPPRVADLVARNSYTFEYSVTMLRGAGADFLRGQTAGTQFVLLGEDHMDHATPLFAGALFACCTTRMGTVTWWSSRIRWRSKTRCSPTSGAMRSGLPRMPVAIRPCTSSTPTRTSRFSPRWAASYRASDAIWGVEQATGATRYLEELVALAPDAVARERAAALLAAATAADPGPRYSVNWLVAATTPDDVAGLAAVYPAPAGSRAARLLAGLAKSAEIFGYYRRAEAGEYVGLYNNTVREEVLKSNFLERYRAAATQERMPRAMFKFGGNHLYHGKNPTQAFPIGNLAHEMAIANDTAAFGLFVIMLGDGYRSYDDYPAWLRPLLPAEAPSAPTIVDLRALRPYQRLFREGVAPDQVWEQRALLHGYDAIVILPGSREGVRMLGGRN